MVVASVVFPQQAAYDSVFALNDEFYNFYPLSSKSLNYDPTTNTLQMLRQIREAGIPRLLWSTSTDGGAHWSTSSALDNGKGTDLSATTIDLRPALATSDDGTPFVVWVEGAYASKRAIFFTRDEGYNLGLWRAPKLLNDTTAAIVANPNIEVTGDGDTVLVTWQGDDNIWFTRSSDGGNSFETPRVVLDKTHPVFPSLGGTQALGIPSLAIGTQGYVLLLAAYSLSSRVDFGGAVYGTGPVYITSKDYGATWSTPKTVPAPAGFAPPGGLAVGHVPRTSGAVGTGSVVLVNNLAHITWVWKKVGADSVTSDQTSVRVFVGSLDAQGNVRWSQISRDHDPCTMISTQGGFNTIGKDANGWLYVLFEDHYPEDAPSRWGPIYVRASKDGGQSWSPIMPVVNDHDFRIWTPEIAREVGTKVYWAGLKGGPWVFTPATAIAVGSVPVDDIFSYVPPPPPPDTAGIITAGYVYKDSDAPGGPAFRWVEIKNKGTLIQDAEWFDPHSDGTPNFAKDDGAAGPYGIGFPFHFFGRAVDSVWVGANGAMSFAGFNNFYPGSIPGAPIDGLVAVFWRDLYLRNAYNSGTGQGDVYYWRSAARDSFIVEWHGIGTAFPVAAGDTLATFQVILSKSDSSITFQYLGVGPPGAETSAVVGVQVDSAGNVGVKYVSGCPLENLPHPGLAVRIFPGKPTSVANRGNLASVPKRFELAQNYPNPFNPQTVIKYALPRNAQVTLKVLNLLGQEVRTLADRDQAAGYYSVVWDGRSDAGVPVSGGLYFYRLEARSGAGTTDFVSVKKMLFIR